MTSWFFFECIIISSNVRQIFSSFLFSNLKCVNLSFFLAHSHNAKKCVCKNIFRLKFYSNDHTCAPLMNALYTYTKLVMCTLCIPQAWCTLKTIKMTRFKNKLSSVIVHHQNTLWMLRIHALFNYYTCVFNLMLLNGRSHTHTALRTSQYEALCVWSIRICKYLSNKCMNSSNPMSVEASILPLTCTFRIQVYALKQQFFYLFIPCIICTKYFGVSVSVCTIQNSARTLTHTRSMKIRDKHTNFWFLWMEVLNLIIAIKWKNARLLVSKVLTICNIVLHISFVSLNAFKICDQIIKGKKQMWH